jgi:hypothetical protein
MEDGSFVTSDRIREATDKLEMVLVAVAEGTLKPDREKDELTYALGTPGLKVATGTRNPRPNG